MGLRSPRGSAPLQPIFSTGLHAPCMTRHLKNPYRRPQRLVRLLSVAGILSALAAPVALPSAVRADEPLRSGTILSGQGETPANVWVRGMEGCVGVPTCSAWLQSGCAPALAGVDPALQAAIVDVADLADGVTVRRIEVEDDVSLNGFPRMLQFWTGTWDVLGAKGCKELLAHRLDRWDGWHGAYTFRIPAGATFMTISSSTDTTHAVWTLW